jgi:hypothetical protein
MQFNTLRRYMTADGTTTKGGRVTDSEGVVYSLDGVHWVNITAKTSTGWQSYTNYRPHARLAVNYGWSVWLNLNSPVYARYVRFNWDGNNDALNEVMLQVRP